MDNINFNMARAEALIAEALSNLPVGVAYYIINSKAKELETLYYAQAKKEMDAAAASNTSSDENPSSEEPGEGEH